MKILFLSSFVWDAAYRGRYFHFLRRLVAGGHSVVVLAPRSSSPSIRDGQGEPPQAGPARVLDAWSGATEIAETLTPDIVIASSPPRSLCSLTTHPWLSRRCSRPPVGKTISGCGPSAGRLPRRQPLLVFDYSDEHYLSDLKDALGPDAHLGETLRRKAVTYLASRADLVIAGSAALRRDLPGPALLLADPCGALESRGALEPTAESDAVRVPCLAPPRRLAVAVLGPFDSGILETVTTLAASSPGLSFVLLTPAANLRATRVSPDKLPANVEAVAPATRRQLGRHLDCADVAVLLPSPVDRTAGPMARRASADGDPAADRLLAALAADCPVVASSALKGALTTATRVGELNASDLTYFASPEDLGEILLRFSLTADPARAGNLRLKADRLRWAPIADRFERALVELLSPVRSGVAGG